MLHYERPMKMDTHVLPVMFYHGVVPRALFEGRLYPTLKMLLPLTNFYTFVVTA